MAPARVTAIACLVTVPLLVGCTGGDDAPGAPGAPDARPRAAGSPGETADLPPGDAPGDATGDTADAFARAARLHEEGRLVDAVAAYGQVLDGDPGHRAARLNRGLARFELLDLDASLDDLDSAIELGADDVDALIARGQVRAAAGRVAEALADFGAALERDPLAVEAYERRADTWVELGEVDAALADYANAIRLAPDDPLLYRARRQLLEEVDRADEAAIDAILERLARDLAERPEDATARLQRAMAFLHLDEPELALADLDRAIEARGADGPSAAVLLARGHARRLLGSDERALADYSAAIEAAPRDAPSRVARAFLYDSIGATAEAAADLEVALESDPDHRDAGFRLAWLLATAREGDVRDGKRSLELASRLPEGGDDPWLRRDTLAAAHAELGAFEEARALAQAALERAPEELRGPIEKRLMSYRENRPHRE